MATSLGLLLDHKVNGVGGGVNKTTYKCKKVWADWKSMTKKKGLAIRQHSRGTGGEPASQETLSAIEERALAIMGTLAVEGQASVEQVGFTRSQSPAQDDPLTVDDTELWQIVDETSHLPTPVSTQPCTSRLLPPPSSTTSNPTHTPRPSPAAPAPPASAVFSTPGRLRPLATPPSARRRLRLRSPATPQSDGAPGRPRLPARRRRQTLTPFERAASEFTAVELRRLEIEERYRSRQHERDMRAIEVEHEQNEVFRSLVNVAQAWLDYYLSRDNSEPMNTK